jgi:hypothetical protein
LTSTGLQEKAYRYDLLGHFRLPLRSQSQPLCRAPPDQLRARAVTPQTPRVLVAASGSLAGRLREFVDHAVDLAGVVVVEPDGRLIDDVSLLELLVADPGQALSELVGPPWPVIVTP